MTSIQPSASPTMKRLSPRAIDGATGRTSLVLEDPDAVVRQAVTARCPAARLSAAARRSPLERLVRAMLRSPRVALSDPPAVAPVRSRGACLRSLRFELVHGRRAK